MARTGRGFPFRPIIQNGLGGTDSSQGAVFGRGAFGSDAPPSGAQGRTPTTVTAELNRLANGGSTYPLTFNGDAGAANTWCGTSGLEVQGALNAKAGLSGTNMLDLDGVANKLAGTSGLGAPEALRRITH